MNNIDELPNSGWQGSLFRVSLLVIGISIGATWSNFFYPYANILSIIAPLSILYAIYSLRKKQIKTLK